MNHIRFKLYYRHNKVSQEHSHADYFLHYLHLLLCSDKRIRETIQRNCGLNSLKVFTL